MAEYIDREALLKALEDDIDKDVWARFASKDYVNGVRDEYSDVLKIICQQKAADVQPVKRGKWCPPLMGQGKCDTYCERCHGKIMRNSTGIFEETPYCPHCGADMREADATKG